MNQMELATSVPHRSVLGPRLWNIFYDSVLKIKIPGVNLIRLQTVSSSIPWQKSTRRSGRVDGGDEVGVRDGLV